MTVNRHRTYMSGALLVLFVAVFGMQAFAEPGTRVTLQVDGMACPFCTYNVEKRIKTLDAVPENPNYEASVDKGQVSFDWKTNVPVDIEAIRGQVRKAGFTPGTIEVKDGSEKKHQGEKKKEKQKSLSGSAQLITDHDQTQIRFVGSASESTRTLVSGDRVDRKLRFERLAQYLKEQTEEEKKKGQKKNASAKIKLQGTSIDGKPGHFRLYSWEPKHFRTMVTIRIDELVCENCVAGVTKKINKLNQVIHVEADFESDQALVWFSSPAPDTEAIRNAVKQAGFSVTHLHTLSVKHVRDREK